MAERPRPLPSPSPGRSPPRSQGFIAQAFRIAAKDLRIEWRSREIIYTMAFLAALVVLIFAFAFISGPGDNLGPGTTAGILWVAVLFSGTVGLSRTFDRERDGEAIRSLLLSPVPRAAIFAGKLMSTALLMLMVQLVVTPLCGLFFSAAILEHAAWLAAILVLGTIGFAAAGTVFSAALLRARSRDVLLSTLLYPVAIPIFLAGTKATSQLLDPSLPDMAGAELWTRFLCAADVLFVLLGVWAFEPIVAGD